MTGATAFLFIAVASSSACPAQDVVANSEPGAGSCEPGTTSTAWAESCPNSAPVRCASGPWKAVGSDDPRDVLLAESEHFAVYSSGALSRSRAQATADFLESTIWPTFFGSPMYFPEPYCGAIQKYKASVMVHSGDGFYGGSWGNGHLGLWIGSSDLGDHRALAFSFMRAVQSVMPGLRCPRGAASGNACAWFQRIHANFAAHQVLQLRSDVHCAEVLVNAPHLYLGSPRDHSCDWQFLEYFKDKYGHQAVSALWSASSPSEDPFSSIAASRGWSASELNDFFGDWAMHNVTWDYRSVELRQAGAAVDSGEAFRASYGPLTDTSRPERRLRLTALEPLDAQYPENRRFFSPHLWAPQRWGYNVVRLYPDAGAASATVTFRGVMQAGADSGWRWGLVATDPAMTKPRYSPLQRGSDGELTFCLTPGENLFLVVMGTPSVQKRIDWDQPYSSIHRYPYMVQLANAWPEGFQGGAPEPCPWGLTRHANGGGCAPPSLPDSVYVGPYAKVLVEGAASWAARIEDHATIAGGFVSGGTVGGLSVITGSFSVAGSARIQTSFYPLGHFDDLQSATGTAWLYGDVEYRGARLDKWRGAYSGLVDWASTGQRIADVTVAPPYSWRP